MIEDLLGAFKDVVTVRERTLHSRETSFGTQVDWEVIETTQFRGLMPATDRETRLHRVLDCGHYATAENPCVGECQRRRLRRDVCGLEYCQRCAFTCPRCARSVSKRCCVAILDGMQVCKACARVLRAGKAVHAVARPFIEP